MNQVMDIINLLLVKVNKHIYLKQNICDIIGCVVSDADQGSQTEILEEVVRI